MTAHHQPTARHASVQRPGRDHGRPPASQDAGERFSPEASPATSVAADDALGVTLAHAVSRRAAVAVVQRVHFPHLRAVRTGAYLDEDQPLPALPTAGQTQSRNEFIAAAKQKMATCAAVHASIAGRAGIITLSQKMTPAAVPAGPNEIPSLSSLGGPYDPTTGTTAMRHDEWGQLLNRWRRLFNANYFSAEGVRGAPGGIPRNFVIAPGGQHDIWLTNLINTTGVHRDSPAEQTQSGVHVGAGGLLYRHSAGAAPAIPVDTSASATWQSGMGWEIYVLSHDGELHMSSHVVGRHHHSSLLGHTAGSVTHAKDAAGAGEMKVTAGKIDQLSIKTGHYQSGVQQLRQVIHLLNKRGANLAGTVLRDHTGAVTAHDAAVWWASPQGQTQYEHDKSDHVINWYTAQHGDLTPVFTALGWTAAPPAAGGRIHWQKLGGAPATAKDFRVALKAHFSALHPHWNPVTDEIAVIHHAWMPPAIGPVRVATNV